MMVNNSVCQYSPVFTVNSRFHFLLEHSIIPCTIDYLSTILAVMDPLKSQNCVVTLLLEGTHLNFLDMGGGVFPLYALTIAGS